MSEQKQIEKSNALMLHYAENTARLLFSDYNIHKSIEKMVESLVLNFTKRDTDEIKSYRLYLISYFKLRNIPYKSLSIKLPDEFMQKSLICYSGNAEFTKKCETCNYYSDCERQKRFRMILMQLIKLFRKKDMLEE